MVFVIMTVSGNNQFPTLLLKHDPLGGEVNIRHSILDFTIAMESCTSETCLLVTHHVIPIIGILTSLAMKLSSWAPVKEAIKTQNLGSFDSVPNAMLMINSLSWFLYGLFIRNPYISFPGIVGVQFMLYYIMSTYHLHSPYKRRLIRNIFMFGFLFIMSMGMIAFIGIYNPNRQTSLEDFNKAKNLLGISSILILMSFYTSPLVNLMKVIRTRDSSSINIYFAIAVGVNGSLWITYGVAISDPFVYLPNIPAIISSVAQLIVKASIKSDKVTRNSDKPSISSIGVIYKQ